MKLQRALFLCALAALLSADASANGVVIFNASTPVVAKLVSSQVAVTINEQVAITRSLQVFLNASGKAQPIKYGFPLPDGASATLLRWEIGGVWSTARLTEVKQDTSLPGGLPAQNLRSYLGATPLYFGLSQQLAADSSITFEITYVQLLGYKNGIVTYTAPNDYSLISTAPLETQKLDVTIASQRTIQSMTMVSHPSAVVTLNATSATASLLLNGVAANANYVLTYQLNQTQFGLFGLSTFLPDSLGYFVVIVEPDPNTTAVIRKNFVIIVDRSGSMAGTKMTQAITAGEYIVNNLNEGDAFDVIDFDDVITPFRGALTKFTMAARDSAVQYIAGLGARGMTDIAGAFSRAVPEFSSAPDTTANIVFFLTDGVATWGQTDPDSILAVVSRLVTQTGKKVSIYNFGIGSDVDQQLLTRLASNNGGFADFLGNDEVQVRVIDFYNTVRNPLLIAPVVHFAPDSVRELYPDPLPNLYRGQQMIITGRYASSGPITVTFSGTAFGKPVSYQYVMPLADTSVANNEFLTKVWAKLKIEHLLVEYYAAAPGSAAATQIKNTIIQLSVQYGVQTPFTSFVGNVTGIKEGKTGGTIPRPVAYTLLGNYPNPFNPGTTIRVHVEGSAHGVFVVKVFNIVGQLVRTLYIAASGPGDYQVYWDGRDEQGSPMPTGSYIYSIDFGNTILAGRMLLVK